MEATDAAPVIVDGLNATGPYGIACLTGVSPTDRRLEFDAGAVNRTIVLENDVIIGSVNANHRHCAAAAQALALADRCWLKDLITRRVRFDDWRSAYAEAPGEVKVVLERGS